MTWNNSSALKRLFWLFGVLGTKLHQVLAVSGGSYPSSTRMNNGTQSLTATTSMTKGAALTSDPPDTLGDCLIGDPHCTWTGVTKTYAGATASLLLSDECLLWEADCSGNKTAALVDFFGDPDSEREATIMLLQENACFVFPSYNCTGLEPDATLSQFPVIKNWMRSPACISSNIEWASVVGQETYLDPSYPELPCCSTCFISAENVDVYYWPEPGSDTSCLSIIGNVTNPPLYGATTASDGVYWGCTGLDGSFVTTATITIFGPGLTVKESLINPWSSLPCGSHIPTSTYPSLLSLKDKGISASGSSPRMYARGHTLVPPVNTTDSNGLPVSTVVTAGYTFTSPSVYANFHGITAGDHCGTRGSVQSIATTMLTFAPGELSTIAGPLIDHHHATTPFPTQQFNFADLPCPPQSIAEANWYKPSPGEPYRPLIAIPQKVLDIDPGYGNCTGVFFTGYDPPTALIPGTALAPVVTSIDPGTPPIAPVPSPTPTSGPRKTTTNIGPTSTPAVLSAPAVDPPHPQSPQSNGNSQPSSDPSLGGFVPQHDPDPDPPNQNNDPDPRLPSSVAGVPGEDPASNGQNSDPGEGSPGTSAPSDPKGLPVQGQGSPAPEPDTSHGQSSPGQTSAANNDQSSDQITPQAGIAIGNNSPGQATVINGFVAQPVSNGISIAGTIVTPEGPGITVSGTSISLSPSTLVVGTSTVAVNIPSFPVADNHVATLNGQVYTPFADGIYIAGTALSPADPPITVSGTPISLDQSGLVVGGIRTPYVPAQPSLSQGQTATIDGLTVQILPNSGSVLVAGITVIPGALTTISGLPISLGSSALIVGSASLSIAPTAIPWIAGQEVAIDGQAIRPLTTSGAISIAGTTLMPGGSAITVSGTVLSLGSSALIIGSSTIPMTPAPTAWNINQAITVNGQAIQPLTQDSAISIAGTTLTPGALAITISGTTISLGPSALVIGDNTLALPIKPQETLTTLIGDQMITANPSAVAIAGSTLTPGAPGITISGTLVSLGTDGALIVGSKTVSLETFPSKNIGGLIMGGLGAGGPFPITSASNDGMDGQHNLSFNSASGYGVVNGSNGGGSPFQGEARPLRGSLMEMLTMILVAVLASSFEF